MKHRALTDDLPALSAAIELLQHDNNALKAALSALLQLPINTAQLEQLELFQNRLISQDAAIRLLSHELSFFKGAGGVPQSRKRARPVQDQLVDINIGIMEIAQHQAALRRRLSRFRHEVQSGKANAN